MSTPDDLPAFGATAILAPEASRPRTAADPHDVFLKNKNFASLNGIRCLCCLAVIKEHVFWDFPAPRLIANGWLGVDLFFEISGFLIVTLLMRERARKGDISLGKFYARRTLRIFPIYYLLILAVLVVFLAVSPWKPNSLRYYAPAFPVLLTYTQDFIWVELGIFNAMWTLAMEEQFYMLWPTVEKFASRWGRSLILGALLAVNQALNFGYLDNLIVGFTGSETTLKRPIILITFTPILLGVLLAYLLNERRAFDVLYKVLGWKGSSFAFLGLLFAICQADPAISQGWTKLAIHVTFLMILGSLVIREDHYARPILALPVLDRLGVISYGIYLYHMWVIALAQPVLNRLVPGGVGPAAMFVVATIGTIAVAEASFRLIEQPLLRLKGRFHS